MGTAPWEQHRVNGSNFFISMIQMIYFDGSLGTGAWGRKRGDRSMGTAPWERHCGNGTVGTALWERQLFLLSVSKKIVHCTI